eukprot:m51a1_g14232 putative aspartate aminotransferase (420) ;mRNA; r:216057-217844
MSTTHYDMDRCPDRRNTASLKWDKWEASGDQPGGVIPMWIADMDAVTAPEIQRALEARVAHGVFGYAHETQALKELTAAWLLRRHSWQVAPEWLVFIPGVVTAMNVFLRSCGGPGEAVHLCHVPAYPPFLCSAQNHGHKLVEVPLSLKDGRWVMDPEVLDRAAEAAGPRAKSLILCHPHNPTGRDWTVAELEAIAEVCERRNLCVASDEIWADLVLDGKHVPFAKAVPRLANRTCTFMAPSKTFNIPGLGCSLAIIPDAAARERFEAAAKGIVSHVNVLGLAGAEAAWGGECDQWLEQLLDSLRKKRDVVAGTLRRLPQLRWYHPQATFLFWVDARDALPQGVSQEKLADWLAERHGLGLSDGAEYGAPGWLRINYGCPMARLEEAMRRFEKAFEHCKTAKSPSPKIETVSNCNSLSSR